MFDELIHYFEEDRDNENSSLFLTMSNKLIMDAFIEQFNNRNCKIIKLPNILDFMDEKFKFLKSTFNENEDKTAIDELNKIEISLYYKILDLFNEKLDLTYNDLFYNENIFFDELKILVNNLYEFFILDYADNIKNLILSYISENYKELVNQYKQTLNKKDLEYSINKKEININSFIISKNLKPIIKQIINEMNSDNMRIINLITSYEKNEANYIYIKELFKSNKCIIGENFDELFFEVILDKENLSILITNIQEVLLKL